MTAPSANSSPNVTRVVATRAKAHARSCHDQLARALLGVLLLGLLGSCGSRTVRGKPSAAAFCEELSDKLETCRLGALDVDECERVAAAQGEADTGRARACLNASCGAVLDCVDDALGPLVSSGGGGTGAVGVGGAAAQVCPSALSCVDPATAQYCDNGVLKIVDCATALAEQGIVSNGCSDDAAGPGCTIDGFLDADCEAGTPAFAVCAGLTEKDLVNTYVACFENANQASAVITCYRDYVDDVESLVDCSSAHTACTQP